MRSFLLIPVVLLACGPGEEPDKKILRYALSAVETPTSAPVATTVNVAATVVADQLVGGELQAGVAAPGVLVNFHVVSGGGTVFAGSAITNSLGIAREVWTLGTGAGDQVIEVRAVDQDTGEPIVYATATTTATPGDATRWVLSWASGATNVFPANQSFDMLASTLLWSTDAYDNQLPTAQTQHIVSIAFGGNVQNGDSPTCTFDGGMVTCPLSTSANWQPKCSDHCWSGYFAVTLAVPGHPDVGGEFNIRTQ